MKSITQDIKYYQAILSCADKHGVTKAAIKYRTYRRFICRLRYRYDGTPESLAPKSRRPHHPPNEHSDEEIALIRQMRKYHPKYRACPFPGAPAQKRLYTFHSRSLPLHETSRSQRGKAQETGI